jgi:hypothetical protein
MHKGADAAGDSSADATPKIDGLAESLNQTTAATTRATKALILQKLQQDGVVSSAGQLGIATSDLIKASLGNQKAIDRVSKAWESQGSILDGLQTQKITDWIYGMRSAMGKAEKSVKDANAALDGTDRSAKRAGDSLRGVGKERPQTDKWSGLLIAALGDAVHQTGVKTDAMRGLLSTGPGKARANLAPFAANLRQQLSGLKDSAHTQGVGVGTQIKTGVHGRPEVASVAGLRRGAAGDRGGIAGAHRATARAQRWWQEDRVPQRTSRQGVQPRRLPRLHGRSRRARRAVAGSELLNGIVRGLKKGERDLHHVMQGLQDYIQAKTDKLNAILSDRSSFVQSFRDSFSESIFSAQNTDAEGNDVAPTLASMKAFAAKQQANAHALSANIKSLLSKGLSRDLIAQLVGQGAAGEQQIAALAAGTAQDIAQFNASNKDVKDTLEGLGADLYEALNPGTQDQIKLLQAQVDSAVRQEAILQKIADQHVEGEIKIKGTDLVIQIRQG